MEGQGGHFVVTVQQPLGLNPSQMPAHSHTHLCRAYISWQRRELFKVPTKTAGPRWQRSTCHRWGLRGAGDGRGCSRDFCQAFQRCLLGPQSGCEDTSDLGVRGAACAPVPADVGALSTFPPHLPTLRRSLRAGLHVADMRAGALQQQQEQISLS